MTVVVPGSKSRLLLTNLGVPAMPSPLVPCLSSIAQAKRSWGSSANRSLAPPPRKPKPSTFTLCPFRFSVPATSSATTPPVNPSHGGAVTVPVSVASRYWGTRMTCMVRRRFWFGLWAYEYCKGESTTSWPSELPGPARTNS